MENRIGEKFTTKRGDTAEIINYRNCNDLDVKFVNGNIRTGITYDNLKKGYVKNTIYDVGYIGVGKFKASIKGERTKAHIAWYSAIRRCYNAKSLKRFPAYKGCSVHKDWHNFQVFAEWFYKNYIDGFSLDKDLLLKGNKVYSESTCVFIPPRINALILNNKASRGKYPLGVSFDKETNKFISSVHKNGFIKRIGRFNTADQAFNAYKKEKEEYIKEVAEEYKNIIDTRAYNALLNYKIEITD